MRECWYEALRSPFGVVVTCVGDPEKVRNLLYKIRREFGDPALDNIVIVRSPTEPQDLWLMKKRVNFDEAQRDVPGGEDDSPPV